MVSIQHFPALSVQLDTGDNSWDIGLFLRSPKDLYTNKSPYSSIPKWPKYAQNDTFVGKILGTGRGEQEPGQHWHIPY